MGITYEDVMRRLNASDYKITPQRQIITRIFLEHAEHHLSAEDVYQLVREKYPDIGLATVYRTLDLLAELNIVQRMNFGDGRHRYELSEGISHHHHHLICNQCGQVYEFGEDLLDALEETIARQSGFRILDHEVKFFGICAQCQAKSALEKD